jgi:hypothetical protein
VVNLPPNALEKRTNGDIFTSNMPKEETPPLEQFKTEIKAVFHRWWEESDLDEKDMAVGIIEVTEEFCDSSIDFESEIDLDDDDE